LRPNAEISAESRREGSHNLSLEVRKISRPFTVTQAVPATTSMPRLVAGKRKTSLRPSISRNIRLAVFSWFFSPCFEVHLEHFPFNLKIKA
jgi:hypothetical protein